MQGPDKIRGRGAWSTFLQRLFDPKTNRHYADFLREQGFEDFLRIPSYTMRHKWGSPRVGFVPNSDSTCSGQVGENQTCNQLPITMGRVGSGSKKRSVGSVEIDERRRQAEEDKKLSDLVGGEQNVIDLSLKIAGSKPKLPIRA